MTNDVDSRIDTLADYLLALDEGEMQRELAIAKEELESVREQMAKVWGRMMRLQAAIIMRRAWEDQPRSADFTLEDLVATYRAAARKIEERIPPRQLKTREMIEDYFREHPGEQIPVVAVRNYLTAQGNEITPEAVRASLRNLAAEGVIDKINRYSYRSSVGLRPADGPQHDPLPAGLSQRLARLNTSGVLGGADTQ